MQLSLTPLSSVTQGQAELEDIDDIFEQFEMNAGKKVSDISFIIVTKSTGV